ncbi:MAG: hypothetical protein ACXWQ5_19605, partial [Ktedonobacterales bacterium]
PRLRFERGRTSRIGGAAFLITKRSVFVTTVPMIPFQGFAQKSESSGAEKIFKQETLLTKRSIPKRRIHSILSTL